MADDGDNVVKAKFGGSPFRSCGDLYDELMAKIMEYDGKVSLMEVIGILHLVQRDVLVRNEP